MLTDFRDVEIRLLRLGRGFLSVATVYDVPDEIATETVRAAVHAYTDARTPLSYPLRIDWPALRQR